MYKRGLLVAAAAVMSAAAIAGCGSSDDSGGGATAAEAGSSSQGDGGKAVRAGFTITGPKNDGSYFQAVYEGFMASAKKHGWEVSGVVDNTTDPQSTLQAVRNLAQVSDLVVGGGGGDLKAEQQMATQFPDVEFVDLSATNATKTPNMHAYYGLESYDAYVAGAVAAHVSKTHHVGFVAGGDVPATIASKEAFTKAAKAEDPNVQVSVTNAGSFSDPTAAKKAGAALIAAGADVIQSFVNSGTPGVLQAVRESGKDVKIISTINNRCDVADEFFGNNTIFQDRIMKRAMDDFAAGKLAKGTKYFGLEDPSIQKFEVCPKYQTPELEKLVKHVTEQINNGELDVPRG